MRFFSAAVGKRGKGWTGQVQPVLVIFFVIALLSPPWSPPIHAQTTVEPPRFSASHGYFSEPFTLALTSATTNAEIRYTTDFTTPTPTTGIVYTGPLPISATTIVRAIAYTADGRKSATVTQSYIFVAQVRHQSNNPGAGWPTVFAAPSPKYGGPYPAYYELAPEIVNHSSNTGKIEASLRALPVVSLVTDPPNLWDETTGIYYNPTERGSAWERPLSIEWFDPAGVASGFTVNAGIRIHGQASRKPHRTPKKTFRIYFKNSYGVGKLDFRLFADPNAVAKFDRILLRGGSNRSYPYFDRDQRRDTDYINDEFARRAFLEMGHVTAHGVFAQLYLNGQYWGLYNVTERLDGRFLEAYFGGAEQDYDLVKPEEKDENNPGAYIPIADLGTVDAWNALPTLLNVATVDDSLYATVQQQLDIVNLADYMILLHYIGNTDWPAHNWYAFRKRSGDDTRFRMIVWDSDTSLTKVNENITLSGVALSYTPAYLFRQLLTHADFRQLVADRFYQHLVNPNGTLTAAKCTERYGTWAAMIDPAIIGESARWGAYARKVYPQINFTVPLTTPIKALPAYFHSYDMPAADSDPTNEVLDSQQKNWLQVRNEKLDVYCPQRTAVVIGQYVNLSWYQTTVKPPAFSHTGGAVTAGHQLVIDNTPNSDAGEIYYTTDGSDPRLAGGAVAPTAVNGVDHATVTIDAIMTVKARVRADGVWSPLQEARFYPSQPLSNLVINEIHYQPVAPANVKSNDLEFLELYNKGAVALQLDDAYFSRGFTYQFPRGTTIQPGAYFVLSPNAAQFQAHYGFAPNGVIQGNLANEGEAIELRDGLDNVIDFVAYQPSAPWPVEPAGAGPSLSLIHPDRDNALASSWVPSLANDGTPGQPNTVQQVKQPPTITITVPTAGAILTAGDTVVIQATVTSGDDPVQKVEFYANDALLCTTADTPYRCSWLPEAGVYALKALVYSSDISVASAVVTATVQENQGQDEEPDTTRLYLPVVVK